MDRNLANLVEELNNHSIDDIKEKIRTKIYKEIEKLRRENDEFFVDLEMLEKRLWLDITVKFDDSNLKNLVNIYCSLSSLQFGIDNFTDIVRRN